MNVPAHDSSAIWQFIRWNAGRIAIGVVLLMAAYAAINVASTGQREHQIAKHIESLGGAVGFQTYLPDLISDFAPETQLFDRIHSVSFSGNPVVMSEIIAELRSLRDLESLELNDSRITDFDLKYLKSLKTIKILDLSNTNLTDAGLENLRELPQLETLSLLSTATTDSGLQHLKSLKRLKLLDLENTNVTEQGKAALKNFLPNCTIIP